MPETADDPSIDIAEASVRSAWNCGAYSDATRCALEAYGGETYSFILSQFHGDVGTADDVFSQFSEDFWRSLPKFEWRCSVRAWCYKLARNAANRHRRSPHNRVQNRVPLSAAPWLEDVVERARTTTGLHLRSEVKDELQNLRSQLSRDEQDLLILRIDRNLSWRDVVHAVRSEELDDASVARAEAALRQRFAEIKKRLRRLAQDAGLI